MAAQTAEQKAAADAAAAEQKAQEEAAAKAAAEAKAAADKAAADKAAADAAANPASKPAAKKKRYTVVGPIAVVRTTDGSERYLYRNAPVDPDAFDAESIKHLAGLGLISEVK